MRRRNSVSHRTHTIARSPESPVRGVWLLRALVALIALGSLVPLARVVADWVAITRVLGGAPAPLPARGYDGVRWEDADGEIVAAYVDARGPAARAGVREGDPLFALDGQQYFGAEDVQRAVERASGSTLVYELTPEDAGAADPRRLEVRVARYPAFLYPLNPTVWTASGWGFALATFVHALALAIVGPLAWRSRRALRSTVLIAAGLLWVGGNFIRILMIAALGPPELVSRGVGVAFDVLTLVALAGWVLFPVLLFRQVLVDAPAVRVATRAVRPMIWLPPLLLGAAVAIATVRGALGPIPPDALLAPLLFYVCLYVGASSALVMGARSVRSGQDLPPAPRWSRAANGIVLLLASIGALYALGWAPGGGMREDLAVGLVVALQLFSLAPVGVVSLSTMRYGRFDRVLTQAVVYVVGLGAAFFGVAGALWALRAFAPDAARSPLLVAAWLVVTLVVMERATARLRAVASGWVQSDRRRSRQRLNRFGDRVRTYLDAQALADDTVTAVGEALGARSVVLFVESPDPNDPSRWVRAAYRPEPPFFTSELMDDVWRMIDHDGGGLMWSRTAELDESEWPEEQGDRLQRLGVALIVPVTSARGESVGALILARKAQRGAVYNLEDAEMLRALCGQVALAVERLGLLERERALMRESAEAQLTALRAQINPHFLFNALNTIAALIASKPAEAEATVQHLASLFRHVLKTGGQPFLPLSSEAELVRQYLAIECARFGDRLEVEEDWEPATLATPVPAFAIQTLVENAVKHGIERRRGDGRVRVGSRRREDSIVVEVYDNGPGIPALFGPAVPEVSAGAEELPSSEDATPAFYGIGLRNVAARLARLYGRQDLLTIESDPATGTLARLILPLTTPD